MLYSGGNLGGSHLLSGGQMQRRRARKAYPPGRNMLLSTEDFTQAPWTRLQGMTVLADQGIAPNGTMTADLLIASQTASRIGGQTNTLEQGERVTASIYVKYVDQDRIAIRLWSGSASPNDLIYARYRFSDDSFYSVAGGGLNRLTTSEPVGNGWVRIIASCDVHETSDFAYLVYGGAVNPDTYGETLAWGAQLEKGPVTPYEPRGAV